MNSCCCALRRGARRGGGRRGGAGRRAGSGGGGDVRRHLGGVAPRGAAARVDHVEELRDRADRDREPKVKEEGESPEDWLRQSVRLGDEDAPPAEHRGSDKRP